MKSNLIVKVNLKDRRTVQPPVPKPNDSDVGMESSTQAQSGKKMNAMPKAVHPPK
jgi:hypothetical protein